MNKAHTRHSSRYHYYCSSTQGAVQRRQVTKQAQQPAYNKKATIPASAYGAPPRVGVQGPTHRPKENKKQKENKQILTVQNRRVTFVKSEERCI